MDQRVPHSSPGELAASPGGHAQIIEVDRTSLDIIRRLNVAIFNEERIINTFEKEDLIMLLAIVDGEAVGFKIGYRENRFVYYSAKGGVLPEYRRQGVALKMLDEMMGRARERGYIRFAYDTFPNLGAGMTIMGLEEGFRVVKADFNKTYKDWRIRLEKRLVER